MSFAFPAETKMILKFPRPSFSPLSYGKINSLSVLPRFLANISPLNRQGNRNIGNLVLTIRKRHFKSETQGEKIQFLFQLT